MKRVCAWCQTQLAAQGRDRRITHTICADCLDNLLFQMGGYLSQYLDSLAAPVVLVNDEGRAEIVNAAASRQLGHPAGQLEGELGGIIFECAYARLPGGCGHTVHCSGCAIRRTVMATFADGRCRLRVPATLTRDGQEQPHIDLHISTEKVGTFVLLRVDALQPSGTLHPTPIPGLADEITAMRNRGNTPA